MKRKLTSSGPRKGNQEITKFFKSLTPQGSKNSCPGMGESVKQAEMIPTDGFREPILEKLQAVKNRFASEQSSREVCLRNGEERDEGSVKMDIGSDTSYLTSSTVGPVKRLEKSSTILTCRVVNNGTNQENGSFARDSVEESDMECDESFFSARGELSTINNNESFEDAVRSPPCNSNDTVTTKSATQKKPLDCKDPLSEPEVQDLSKSLCVDLRMKDPSKTEARNCSDIIVVNCNKTCVEKNTLLQSACIDEDSQDELLLEGSESSDEDLLTPPRFLSEKNRLKPDIRTPEKGIAPEYSSPITPSPAVKETREDKSFNYKLSFNKLIAEKAKRREKDAELAEMEAELQRGIQNGGVAQIEPYCFSDMESEEEQIDDGRDLKDCALPQDIKKFLVEVHDFSEELPGEDVFPMFLPCAIPQDIPCLAKVTPPERDTFEAKLASASELDLQELLCGGWILQYYLNKPCSVEVAEWLFQIMCRHQDQHILSSSFQVLWVMLDAATEKRDDLPPISRGISWLPSVRKVILELLSYGATLHRLYPDSLADDLNVHELMSSNHSTRVTEAEDSTLVNSGVKTENFPVVNTMHLVQFLTYGLQKCPLLYTVQDLRQLVVLLCRLALDVRLQTVVFDIEMCIAAALNYFGEAQWPDEVKELCRIVAKLSTDHRNLLHLVQIQPPSVRGIYLQRLLSLSLLHWLVPRFMSHRYQEGTGKFPTNERCNVDVPDSVQVSCLVKLAEKLKAGEHSDYFLLHSVVSLLSLAVGAEDVAPKERTALERLTSRLRALNGDIKDPRAAFMDRTKVKDLLVRTIHRLAYMTQCIKPAREQHITTYFERSSSDYQIELLKETADPAEKEGVGDEKLADEKQMESSKEKRNTAE